MPALRAIDATAAAHVPHALHAPDRPWPETNCYLDLWIELLAARGIEPRAILGACAALDWEGDHVTFVKPCAADIRAVSGGILQELALWDDTARQVATQLALGAVPLLEVDAFFLPDTQGAAYRERHTKTTIGIIALDRGHAWLEYFHNAGLFRLEGEDVQGVLGLPPHAPALFPYAELVRWGAAPDPDAQRGAARQVLARALASRQKGNPVARFAADLPGLLARVADDPHRVHALCFNTARQLGSACGLLADHLAWLGGDGSAAARLAGMAKSLQFLMARAARRQKEDPAIATLLGDMAHEHEGMTVELARAAAG